MVKLKRHQVQLDRGDMSRLLIALVSFVVGVIIAAGPSATAAKTQVRIPCRRQGGIVETRIANEFGPTFLEAICKDGHTWRDVDPGWLPFNHA